MREIGRGRTEHLILLYRPSVCASECMCVCTCVSKMRFFSFFLYTHAHIHIYLSIPFTISLSIYIERETETETDRQRDYIWNKKWINLEKVSKRLHMWTCLVSGLPVIRISVPVPLVTPVLCLQSLH